MPMETLRNILRIDKVELKRLLGLMFPLYVANLLYMGMGVVDTIVAGRAGTEHLAAVALAGAVMAPIMVSIGAIVTMVGPMVAHLRGAGQERRIGLLLNNAKVLAFYLMAAQLVTLLGGLQLLRYVADTPELGDMGCKYLVFIMFSIPASVGIRVLQSNFEGFGQTRPALVVSTIGFILNVPLNFIFVFGWGWVPALGGPGCGLATCIVHWMVFFSLSALSMAPRYRHAILQMLRWHRPNALCGRILRLGFPIGVATLCEMSFFCVVILVIAPLGKLMVSAQQIAINISAIIFMLPFSLAAAAAIRAAYHVGAGNKTAFDSMVRTLYIATYALVLVFMAGTILLRRCIVGCYTDNVAVLQTASTLLIYCAVYQISDATQCLTAALLRGCHDTSVITWINLCCYWLVGFPLACILIRTDWIVPAMGPAGAWVSFIVALTLAACFLVRRFRNTRKRVFR